MKVFILCGGFGTRLDHEGTLIAKPMVRIGPDPILMHIIKNYHNQGYNDFVFCLGHKSQTIINYFLKEKKIFSKIMKNKKSNIEFTFKSKNLFFKGSLIYTGLKTGTGGRIKKAYNQLNLNEDIMMTYGDGLSNIPIKKLVKFHYKNNSKVTLTAVRPKERYGVLKIKNNKVTHFDNENKKADTHVNGGFFIVDKSAIKKIINNNIYWEQEPLNFFTKKKQLYAFKHDGFWKSLDTLKDKNDFNKLFNSRKKSPWKI
ncbi:sugar phosphate nucleotidyltransferase [Candidatus Pelagibacter sp.]|jgi:glucose-1-phosphate cytidylyltransferase|nr:sugar phosphate nucleotidyltransferase [Candidatus Pelagibacter sp.]